MGVGFAWFVNEFGGASAQFFGECSCIWSRVGIGGRGGRAPILVGV